MAGYTGMTPRQIIEKAMTIAKKNGFQILFAEARAVFDEAMLWVSKDIIEYGQLYSATWPTTDQVAMGTNNILHPIRVYGDAKELVFIPYEIYRKMFLGDVVDKPSSDTNNYYTILGRTIYLEPDLEGTFTNVVIEHGVRSASIETGGVDVALNLNLEYSLVVSYKICQILCPAQLQKLFFGLYKDAKKEAISFKNKLYATGHATFWNPFAGGKQGRSSGWPGKISNE